MAADTYRAMVVRETESAGFEQHIEHRRWQELPAGEVLIQVHYSSLNYKDALSARGHKGISKHYPHTPGIDAAGVVVESQVPQWRQGDEVVVTGYDLGMNTSGGFAEYIRVPAPWVLALPQGLDLRTSMIFGTAGLTAGLCLRRLLDHGIDRQDPVLVTGASGGVGSLALAILAQLGFRVTAASGKKAARDYLTALGAKTIIDRQQLAAPSESPLLKGQWAGAVDTLGGPFLATVLKSLQYGGAVSCCGLAASAELATTVYPFILRGITLYGIDSAQCPPASRAQIWQRLAQAWRPPSLDRIVLETSLDGLAPHIEAMLSGRLQGRVLVNLRA